MADHQKGDTTSWDASQVHRQAERRTGRRPERKRKKRRRHMNPFLYLILVFLSSALLAGSGWLLFSDFCAFNRGGIVSVVVEVTADDSLSTIAEKLQEAGLIRYKWFFKLVAESTGAGEEVGVGTYTLNTDMDYTALIHGMHNASGNLNTDTVRVMIPEGFTVEQTISLLASKGVNTKEALLEAAKTADFNYSYIDDNAEEISRLEGFLFPDTYDFYLNEKPANALGRLLDNFDRKMDEDHLADVEASGYTLQQIITIASLIEKETDGTDQSKIASVIYNRLEGPGDKAGTHGLLQIDAALLYGLPGHEGAITGADKESNSPYNLYKKKGLPPTPIANPGIASINAALNPERTEYYYYALGKDGKHQFFTNYNDHQNFVSSGEYIGN